MQLSLEPANTILSIPTMPPDCKFNEKSVTRAISTQNLLFLQMKEQIMDNEIILYQPDNSISLEVRVEDETSGSTAIK